MNMREPDVLKSRYVSMNEDGAYVLDKDAPPSIVQQLDEYLKSITVDGFTVAEPLPKIPPLNK